MKSKQGKALIKMFGALCVCVCVCGRGGGGRRARACMQERECVLVVGDQNKLASMYTQHIVALD